MKAMLLFDKNKISKPPFKPFLSGLLLAFASAAVFAADHPIESLLEKYSEDQLQESIASHTIVATSKDNIHQIPPSYLYRSALLRIILNEEISRKDFNSADWAIIQALPDHSDIRFAERNVERIQANCSQILALSQNRNAQSIRNMAALAAQSEQQPLADLDNHYADVLASLSAEGRIRVEKEVESLPEVSHLAWSTVDLVGLSDEIPEYVEVVVIQSCERISAAQQPEFQTRLLKDVPSHWVPMDPR